MVMDLTVLEASVMAHSAEQSSEMKVEQVAAKFAPDWVVAAEIVVAVDDETVEVVLLHLNSAS